MSRLLDRALGGLGVVLVSLSAAVVVTAVAPSTAGAADDSAVTVRGTGAFADLQVTVSKTRGLTNEVVQVDWTGAAPTQGNFAVNYLQVMQCWGDAPTGPEREQCQFGGLVGDARGGDFSEARQVTYSRTLRDPRETYVPTPERDLRQVPFRSVGGKVGEAGLSEFFDASTTNEVPYARTRADGGGSIPFEVQTGPEAPGLGCGNARPATAPGVVVDTPTATVGAIASSPAAAVPGLRCWLVVVPRGDREVDGSQRGVGANQLVSSPLSQTNWNARLVVPLDLLQVGRPCPLGSAERQLVGHEDVVEAVNSWAPALCAGGGAAYAYSQLSDLLARSQVVGPAAPLAITSRPLPASQVPASRQPAYAPVALSGLTIAFNIDSAPAADASPEVRATDGQRLTQLNLTARLVAKLLTQSYQVASPQDNPAVADNPADLTRDPDFVQHNPQFAGLAYAPGIGSLILPAGQTDTTGLLWEWVLADPEAKAFLEGTPDPFVRTVAGREVRTKVNPAYLGTGQQDSFPKRDAYCQAFPAEPQRPQLCTLDAFPYATDGHEAARATARGDTLARSLYDAAAVPPGYRRQPLQIAGARVLLTVVDTATAARFGLPTAKLRNASGAFVAADAAGLANGLLAMRPGTEPTVLEPDVRSTLPAAYPLTSLSHAVVVPGTQTAESRKEYAAFLRYAAGPGQVPTAGSGGLPVGYASLPQALRDRTLAVADALERSTSVPVDDGGPVVSPNTPPVAAPAASPYRLPAYRRPVRAAAAPAATSTVDLGDSGALPPDGGTGTAGSPLGTGTGTTELPPIAAGPVPAAAAPPGAAGPAPQAAPVSLVLPRTPTASDPVGSLRYAVALALLLGGAAALAGAFLRRRAAGVPLLPRRTRGAAALA